MNDRLLLTDTQVAVGEVWMVQDRVRWYPAEVLGFVGTRVRIRAVCPKNITATPTLAQRYRFNNRPNKGYWLILTAEEAAAC